MTMSLCVPCFAVDNITIDATALRATETEGIFETKDGKYIMDFVELNFNYDFYQKSVYVYSEVVGDWQDALEAQKVVVRNPYIRACYMDDSGYSGGTKVLQIVGKVVTWESESYSDPWQTANYHMFLKLIEEVDATVGNYKFMFGDFRWQ